MTMSRPDRPAGAGSVSSARLRHALVIEASTYHASVAVVTARSVVAERAVDTEGGRSERDHLMPAVAAVMEQAGVGVAALDRVVCGSGPGSFTSLRIAAALGKGLVTRPGGPRLAAVSSLLLIVSGAVDRLPDGAYVASLDALRGERHAALVTVSRAPDTDDATTRGPRLVVQHAARRLTVEAVCEWARAAGATVIGPGCTVDAWPAARGVLSVWDAVRDVDLEAWEPDYGRLAEADVRRAAVEAAGRIG
jgi:tRNA threonylcarbamoyladenosine biosynthesis protein TsaB